MIEQIFLNYHASDYDFRTEANPEDPHSHFFANWVPKYRMKAAIAQALGAERILEIGVGFGYSGAAFLHGCPAACYTGIDADDNGVGSTKGAIDWARRILNDDRHEIVLANTRTMDRLPGGIFDLIHINRPQDGDSTFHDLELAIRQGRHVLVDGYLWSPPGFRAISEFLLQQKDLIDYYVVIPGYAGELLIKVRKSALTTATVQPGSGVESRAIREAYDHTYYLEDCGGWDSFGQSRGRDLRDPRLRCVFDLAMLRRPQRVLDLGCGRGEIAYQAAAQGCKVVALDYSAAAIEIARATLEDAPEDIKGRITLLCEDATKIELSEPVDVAVAGDLIEHMAPVELDRLYAAVASQLTPAGMFVVHTFPNKWYYDYDYRRRRRIATSVGAYLPPNPRTRFEQLMHINEQSPRVLREQLRRHFPHVLLWFGTNDNPAGSLRSHYSPHQLAAQRDLFALASTTPINPEAILELFSNKILSADDIAGLRLVSKQGQVKMVAHGRAQLAVTLENNSLNSFGTHSPAPVHFAYHLLRAGTREMLLFDGQRSVLVPSSAPGTTRHYSPSFVAPAEPGEYVLQMSLVQEGVRWFEVSNPAAMTEIVVHVTKS